MNVLDISYVMFVNILGWITRKLLFLLPRGWQLRLCTMPTPHINCDWIWLHAVSVGELLISERFIKELVITGYKLHVTTGTLAGLELLKKIISNLGFKDDQVAISYFPLDDNHGLKKIIDHPPLAFISVETEIWPNLLRKLKLCNVYLCIINGRLTERSLFFIKPWISLAISRFDMIIARDEQSMKLFSSLKGKNVILGGNLKADIVSLKPLHAGWLSLRQAWRNFHIIIAGSIIADEEQLILRTWDAIKSVHPNLRLIIAPRQPNRFKMLASILKNKGIKFHKASDDWIYSMEEWRNIDVILLDTIGELATVYSEGSIALVGGGWASPNGHNPIEPVYCGLPTFLGPGYKNFSDLMLPLIQLGYVQIINTQDLVVKIIVALSKTPLRPFNGLVDLSAVLPNHLNGSFNKTWITIKNELKLLKK